MIRAVLLWLSLSGPALACAVQEPFAVTDLANAPVLVRGQVTGYAYADHEGVITFRVTRILAGKAPATLILHWQADMAEMAPVTWDRPAAAILAARPPQDGQPWRLLVEMCGSAHLVPDTPQNLAAINAALRARP